MSGRDDASGRKRVLQQMLFLGGLLGLWAVAAWLWSEERALPGPGAVLREAFRQLPHAALWRDVAATAGRVVAGVGIASVLGAALGVALGRRAATWRAAGPAVDFARAVPPILTFPVFLLAMGYGEVSRVAAIVAGSALIVTLHVAQALRNIPTERADAARLLGLRGLRLVTHLHVFELLPALFTGVRLALAAGLIIAVVSEMLVGAPAGLGARALSAQVTYRADLLWLVILLSGAVGAVLSGAVVFVERSLVHWTGQPR